MHVQTCQCDDLRHARFPCLLRDKYCELAKVSRSTLKHVSTPFHENRIAKPTSDNDPQGHLQPIASKVLMKILFAARMARWDLLRAMQSLASRVTKWLRDCDVPLHRLVSYINSSLDIRMQGFIGDKIGDCKLWLFCDADWAGEYDSKSTSGCALYLVGPNTYYPLNAFSKKQTSLTMSSTESEVVSANHGVRAQGLPSLSLWQFLWKEVVVSADRKVRPKNKFNPHDEALVARIESELDKIRYGDTQHEGKSIADVNGLNVHLSSKFQVQFLEDNQATITIITKGDSEKMRHTDRTPRISFGWFQQQFERGLFNMINVGTDEQVADIFTKPFADKTKWHKALALINHVDCSKQTLRSNIATKDSDSHLLHKPHVHTSPAAHNIQQQTHSEHDRPPAAAANARHTPRPTDCNRILVEFCCDEDSKLGQVRHASRGCHVLRVTEQHDATKMSTIRKLVRQIHQLCDEGGGSKELLIWASLPCTGGCSWQRINEAINPEKVQRHRDQYLTLFKSLKQVLRLTKRHKPALAIELPKSCQYWQYAVVQCLIKEHSVTVACLV